VLVTPNRKLLGTVLLFLASIGLVALAAATHKVWPLFLAWLPLLVVAWLLFPLVLLAVWGVGNTMVIFLAAIIDVPRHLLESAELDGAGALQRFQYITLPSIRYTILLVALLSSIWTANSFENVWIMTQGGPSDATMIFPVLAFFGLQSQRLGEAAAVSVALLPALALLVFILAQLMLRED